MANTNPILQSLVDRVMNIHSGYRHLELYYSELPLSSRRHLYGSSSTPTKELHQLAEAKFFLAAILSWSPASYGYNVVAFESAGSPVFGREKDAPNELCPIWEHFFQDMAEIDGILSRWRNSADAKPDLTYADSLIAQAEAKLNWAQNLYNIVAEKGEYSPGANDIVLSHGMIYKGWNNFCLKIVGDLPFFEAIDGLREPHKFRYKTKTMRITELEGNDSRRIWFGFVMPAKFQPWAADQNREKQMSPAQHKHRQLAMSNPEPRGFHPQCADDSPCRAPPDFCPHKAQGEECPNTNCMWLGPWIWPCIPRSAVVPARLHAPVNSANHAPTPVLGSPSKSSKANQTLSEYNIRWKAIAPNDPGIPFPTQSLDLYQLLEYVTFGLPKHVAASVTDEKAIELKASNFFLAGFGVEHSVQPVLEQRTAKLIVRFRDKKAVGALMAQLAVEMKRWDAVSLNRRTGVRGVSYKELGDDWVSAAIRKAVENLRKLCERELPGLSI